MIVLEAIMAHEFRLLFWACMGISACSSPPAKQPSGGSAQASASSANTQTATPPITPTGASAEARMLSGLQRGCVKACTAQHGEEAACTRLCVCIADHFQRDPAAMHALGEPSSGEHPSPELQQAIVAASSPCYAATSGLPRREYQPKALRELIGTKVDVPTDH